MDNDALASSPTPRRVLLLVVALMVVALAIGGTFLWQQGRATDPVHLEAAAGPGPAPFIDAALDSEPAVFTDAVRATVVERTSGATADPGTGLRRVSGSAEGLYVASSQVPACDTRSLAEGLRADPDTAAAWSRVREISPDSIPDHLSRLFPAYLGVDTAVTNHRLVDGVAVPVAAVLQAGTAVLVDAWGIPVVRCACGNPLLPPAPDSLYGAEFTGAPWEGFEATAVHTVASSATPIAALRALDAGSAEVLDVQAGGAILTELAPVFLVTSVSGDPASATRGALHLSEDATSWEKVLDGAALTDIDTGADLAVAVGTDGVGGVIHTSRDGRTWSAPLTVIDPLVDVAHREGTWVAVGNRSFAEESGEGDGSAGAVYLSTDEGTSWQRVATMDPYGNPRLGTSGEVLHHRMHSVGHGEGTWVVTATECAYRICELVQFTSPDARTWTRHALDSELLDMDVRHDGNTWGFVGAERDPTGVEENMASKDRPLGLAGTSTDGLTWHTGATLPGRPLLTGLGAGPEGWYAVEAPTHTTTGLVPATGRVHHSTDLLTWSPLGVAVQGATGIAVLLLDPAGPRDSTRSASPAPTVMPVHQVTSVHIHTAGISLEGGERSGEMIVYGGPASAAVEALTSVLGDPVVDRHSGDGICGGPTTGHTWGALTLRHDGEDASAPWRVSLGGDAALPTVAVTTPEGLPGARPPRRSTAWHPVPRRSPGSTRARRGSVSSSTSGRTVACPPRSWSRTVRS